MSRFPLRLKAKIRRAQFARLMGRRATGAGELVLRVEVMRATNSGNGEAEARVEQEILSGVADARAPIVWIGGEEPLLHAACGKLAREIADSERFVFVETDGRFLRRRIHEFRPVNALYLTVRFAARGEHWALGLEGIRTAKLSGFLVCAHLPVSAETEVAEVISLVEKLRALDVDGYVVTGEAAEKIEAVWDAIGDRKWMEFSHEIEDALRGEVKSPERKILRTPRELEPEEESDSREEGVRVS